MEMMKNKGRMFPGGKVATNDILPFDKMKEQKMRERLVRLERFHRAMELRRYIHTHTHTHTHTHSRDAQVHTHTHTHSRAAQVHTHTHTHTLELRSSSVCVCV